MSDWTDLIRRRLARLGRPVAPADTPEAIAEIADHLEDVYRAAIGSGASPAEAHAAAEAELAGLDPLASAIARRASASAGLLSQAVSKPRPLAGLPSDARRALRQIRRRPGFAAIVITTLAVAIGSCTAVFSIANAILIRSLPYPDAGRLVLLWETDASDPSDQYIVAAPVYEDWAQRSRTLDRIGIWEYLTFNIAADAEPEQVAGVRASSSLFDVLGVSPVMGRTFRTDEDTAGRHVAVISDAVWRTHFEADPRVVGRTLRLNGEPYEVIGVMPPRFPFPRDTTSVWVPMSFRKSDRVRDAHSFFVAGRLKDDVTFDQARAEIQGIGRAVAAEHPENEGEGATLTRMSDYGLPMLRTMVLALGGAVGFVLLIACVNVASLQASLGLARRREFVTRLALGAGHGRLAAQLLLEGLALAICGGLAGTGLAWLATRSLGAILTPEFLTLPLRGAVDVTLDARVLLFTLAISVGSALAFGLAPLLGLRRTEPQSVLREGGRTATRTALGARRVLVALEVALAIVVLCGAGLLIRSLVNLLHVDPGLDPDRVMTVQVSLPQANPYGPAERDTFCADLTRRLDELSLFAHTGAVSHLPLSGANAGRGFRIDGRPAPAEGDDSSANYRVTCPGYFATLGIPVTAGRDFTLADRRGGAPVVIINQATADRYWPGTSPLGQRIRLTYGDDPPWMTIVGVTANVRHFGLEDVPHREMFVPYGQLAWPVMTVVARTTGALTSASGRALHDAIRRIDPELPAASVRTMTEVVERSVGWRESFLRLVSIFAAIGLLLAALGVYGALAYYVSQRRRELGVRLALGATRRGLVQFVMRQALVPIAVGLGIGIAGSLATGPLLASLLFQVGPGDPAVTASIVALLAIVALAASWAPARRAAAIDPVRVLREE